MSALTFRTITNATATDLSPLHALVVQQHTFAEFGQESVWVNRELLRTGACYVVAALEGDAAPLGFAMVEPHGDGEPIASVEVWVAPAHHRQGIGTALFDQVAAAHPQVALISVVTATGPLATDPEKSAGYAFASAVGFTEQTFDTVHHLGPDLPKATLKTVAADLKAAHPQVRVKSHIDSPPDELLYQIALAYRAVWDADAPDPDSVDEGFVQECAERFQETLQRAESEGFTPLITTATSVTGDLVGFLVVDIPETDDQPVQVGNAMLSPEVPESVEPALVVSALRTCAVLFPGLAGVEVFVEGSDADKPGRSQVRARLRELGFTTELYRAYVARPSLVADDDAADDSGNRATG